MRGRAKQFSTEGLVFGQNVYERPLLFYHGEIELPINLCSEEMVGNMGNGMPLYVDQREGEKEMWLMWPSLKMSNLIKRLQALAE